MGFISFDAPRPVEPQKWNQAPRKHGPPLPLTGIGPIWGTFEALIATTLALRLRRGTAVR